MNRRKFLKMFGISVAILPVIKVATTETDLLPLACYQPGLCESCIHETTFDSHSLTCKVCYKFTKGLKKEMAELDRELEDEMINGTNKPANPDVDIKISDVLNPKEWILP